MMQWRRGHARHDELAAAGRTGHGLPGKTSVIGKLRLAMGAKNLLETHGHFTWMWADRLLISGERRDLSSRLPSIKSRKADCAQNCAEQSRARGGL
jgi:hypothetical protein